MPNSSLKNKQFKIPPKVHNRIKQQLKMVDVNDKHEKGYKRANDLIKSDRISYEQMNRLKNYFDTYEGNEKDNEFRMIGGDATRKWVTKTLETDTENIKRGKEIRMAGDMENQFIKPHEKDNENTNINRTNGGMIDITKSAKMRNIMANDAVYQEEIKTIKYLIEYLNK